MNQRPAFRAATDRLRAEGIPLRDVAKLFDVSPGTVTRWRSLSPKERLTPPPTWRASLASFVRDAVGSMADRGEKLEALAVELDWAQIGQGIITSDKLARSPLTFHGATALLINRGVNTRAIADALKLKPQTVRAMRSGSRNPPPTAVWVPTLVKVAERHGFGDLAQLFP